MTGFGRKNNDVLVTALAGGTTVADAARNAGVSERTAYRRLESAEFRRRIDHVRAEIVGQAMGALTEAMTEAAGTLRRLLQAEREPVRLGAARSILEFGQRLRESVELEARIAAMESTLEADTDGKGNEQ